MLFLYNVIGIKGIWFFLEDLYCLVGEIIGNRVVFFLGVFWYGVDMICGREILLEDICIEGVVLILVV